MLKGLLSLTILLAVQNAMAFDFTVPPYGEFSAPESNIATPNVEARRRLFLESSMPGGRFKGQPAELFERRPPVLLKAELNTSDGPVVYKSSMTEKILTMYNLRKNEDVLVANVEHMKKWYIAIVPLDSVQSIDMVYSVFMNAGPVTVASHYLTMFNFDPELPVMLVAELPTKEERLAGADLKILDVPIIQNHLLSSIEATYAEGHGPYDLNNGFNGWFQNSFTLRTVSSRLIEVIQYEHPHHRYRSTFNPADSRKILEEALHTSDRSGLQVEYNTALRNCTTEASHIYRRATSDNVLEVTGDYLTMIFNAYPAFYEGFGASWRGYVLARLPDLGEDAEYREEFKALKKIYKKIQ